LISSWQASGLSLASFLGQLGYGNIPKACRAFDQWLATGSGSSLLIDRLAQSGWAPGPAALAEALRETQEQEAFEHDAAARARFRPMIQARPEWRAPGSIVFFGLTGGHRRETCYLPESFVDSDRSDQDLVVREWVAAHQLATGGRTRFFGLVTGYWLFLRDGELPWLYSVHGERLRQVDERPIGEARLSIGGRRLPLTLSTGHPPHIE
jgi:hypothetical protein